MATVMQKIKDIEDESSKSSPCSCGPPGSDRAASSGLVFDAGYKDGADAMARTQKNKATAHHLGLLKAKLAKLRRELLEPSAKGGGAGAGEGFDVTKSGDARVGLKLSTKYKHET
ncbi:hypothetical protein Taro_045195 [Colocasia esculenta]|uniref:Uncharacterized protein n=1 Tax=Colocasia esculenta TaxID=4460 RepID=A0A843WZR1_COLES|nr:hypothetical protein [Colocasia esculenta]